MMRYVKLVLWLLAFAMVVELLFYLASLSTKRRLIAEVSAGRKLYLAMTQAAFDHQQDPSGGVPYPAESGIHSTVVFLDRLVDRGYLDKKERAACGDLIIANVSERDAGDTLLIVSRKISECLMEKSGDVRSGVCFSKSGDGIKSNELPSREKLPPRTPAFLLP